ncbi:hypothetical protein GCM10009030_04530 [Haloarcula pellucida]|uniref:Uncharacterized protein n=2 Tax=Haloarcula pellucida TaxID=1427151 RepID=A0A830GID6_9EURY|nr:hypothetical protein GCM10009030_04530 [Halomicroarcula pellucida]
MTRGIGAYNGRYLGYRGGRTDMVQTGAALALIAITLLCLLLLYFATIKYVSAVLLEDEGGHEGNTSSGGPAA